MEKLATMILIDIYNLLPGNTDLVMLNMDASDASPAPKAPDGGAVMAQPARSPPPQRSPPLPDRNFITTKVIIEKLATTP